LLVPGKDKEEPSTSHEVQEEGSGVSTRSTAQGTSRQEPSEESHIHPRKRKLRQRQQDAEQSTPPPIPPPQHMEKPTNPYELYFDIRKTVRLALGLLIHWWRPLLLQSRWLELFCPKIRHFMCKITPNMLNDLVLLFGRGVSPQIQEWHLFWYMTWILDTFLCKKPALIHFPFSAVEMRELDIFQGRLNNYLPFGNQKYKFEVAVFQWDWPNEQFLNFTRQFWTIFFYNFQILSKFYHYICERKYYF
jgi:hypothetical protein